MQNLISVEDLLKRTWDQYSRHFKTFREPLIWVLVPSVIAALLPIIPGTTQGTSLLVSIISIVITVWASARIIDISWMLHEGKAAPSSLTRSLGWGSLGRVADYAITTILYQVIVFAGLFLLIAPGVLFANWFAFAPLITLLEGEHGTGALKRSKELVEGRFWPLAGRWIALNLIPTLVAAVLVIVLTALAAGLTGQFDTIFMTDKATMPWWTGLISNVSSVALMPYLLIGSVILFAEARKVR